MISSINTGTDSDFSTNSSIYHAHIHQNSLGVAFFLFCCLSLNAQERVRIDGQALQANIDRQLTSTAKRQAKMASIELPWFDGGQIDLIAEPAPQFAPELQARYPEIRSYRVVDTEGRHFGRLNTAPEGIFLVLLGEDGAVEIDRDRDDATGATSHTLERISLQQAREGFSCEVDEEAQAEEFNAPVIRKDNSCFQLGGKPAPIPDRPDQHRRIRRRCRGTLAGVNAAFNDRLAELNAIYESELAITFQLIAGNDVLVNLDASSDPFTDPDNTTTSLPQTEAYIEATLDAGDYDIGHGLHISPGGSAAGRAGIGVVCTNSKASGYSTLFSGPGLVIFQHEVGHQFGCFHTNYGCNNTGAQRYEPGQGVTIMGTGANCDAGDTYDRRSNVYFHVGSLQAIENRVNGSAACFTPVTVANQAPSSDASAATGVTIPARTAFVLEGSGSDPNSNSLEYNWEQFDTDTGNTDPPTGTAAVASAPLFRSFAPASAPTRYLPELGTILAGEMPDGLEGEILPTVDRTLTFRLTVRDNATGIACDEASIQVVDTGEPFRVTSQNSPRSWLANGSNTETVTWNVAGTADGAIATPNVDLYLSTDGGLTYPITLATATPNDGSHTFTVPALETTTARVMVRGSGNIFLDVNDTDITLTPDPDDVCDAATSFVSPAGDVIATAGDPSLHLDLTENYGERLTSPLTFVIDNGDGSGRSVGYDESGDCEAINFGGYFETRGILAGNESVVTFTRPSDSNGSGGFIPTASLFTPPYSGDCTGFLGSTVTYVRDGGIRIENDDFTANLVAGAAYELVGYGTNSGATGELSVGFSGGDLYAPVADPGSGFSYTYGIVDEGSGNIVAFDADSDLSNAGQYPNGSYTVFGLSYQDGADLATYVGGSRAAFEAAVDDGDLCAVVSDNEVAVTISSATLPVELASFSGEADGAIITLHWETEAEVGTEAFYVQRLDKASQQWRTLGSVAAKNAAANYIFSDTDPVAPTHYYRLDIRDFDGYREYSGVVAVARGGGECGAGIS